MSVQNFQFTKVSELPAVTQISDNDVIIINHNGITSKMTYQKFKELIQAEIDIEITELQGEVETLKTATSNLAGRVTDLEGTVQNIITAGFNLIGVDVGN